MRYLLFAGDVYYPRGGFNDFYGMAESVDDLSGSSVLVTCRAQWFHIYDTKEDCIVAGTIQQGLGAEDLEESNGVQIFTL